MSDLAPVLTGCHVCRHPQVDLINRRMKEGVPVLGLIRWMKDEGMAPFHRNTLQKHRARHLTDEFERKRVHAVQTLQTQAQILKPSATSDIAQLVRDVAVARVASGEVKPSISEGLRAQALLDARTGKALDVTVRLMIARALGGAVEGEWRPVAPSSD